MFPELGAVLGLLQPVAGGLLRRGLKFQICKNSLNNFFNNSGNCWVPPPPTLKPAIYIKCYTFAYSQITPPTADIKNEWSYTSVAPVRHHGECRDNFTPSFADTMTPVLPPLINSSLWTQRYWRHWKGSGKIGYFTSFFEFVRQLIGRKKINERDLWCGFVGAGREREDREWAVEGTRRIIARDDCVEGGGEGYWRCWGA